MIHEDSTSAQLPFKKCHYWHMEKKEIEAALQADRSNLQLIHQAQRILKRTLSPQETSVIVSLHVLEGMPTDVILLGLMYFTANGTNKILSIEQELLRAKSHGVETCEEFESYLMQLQSELTKEEEIAALFNIPANALTQADKKIIQTWINEFSYDKEIIREAIRQAKAKKNIRYVNGILKVWHGKNLTTLQDIANETVQKQPYMKPDSPAAKPVLNGSVRKAPVFCVKDKTAIETI